VIDMSAVAGPAATVVTNGVVNPQSNTSSNPLVGRVTSFFKGLSGGAVGAAVGAAVVVTIVAIAYASFRYLTRPTYESLMSKVNKVLGITMMTPKSGNEVVHSRCHSKITSLYKEIVRLGLVPKETEGQRKFYLDAWLLKVEISAPIIHVGSLTKEETQMLDNAKQMFSTILVALKQKTEIGEGPFRAKGDDEEVNELFNEFRGFKIESLTSKYLDEISASIDGGKANHFTLIKRIVTKIIPLGLDLSLECEDLMGIFTLILKDEKSKMTKETLKIAFPAATAAISKILVSS
jgi:hypothetical protein